MQCATLYARLCASLCKILCQIIITLCCAVNWLWGGAGDGVVEERGWEVVDLAVERAVKLVNGRSALGKDPQGGWPEHPPHHTGFESLMQSAKPYSKQTFCPDAKINTYFQTLLKEIKKGWHDCCYTPSAFNLGVQKHSVIFARFQLLLCKL